MSRGSSYCLPLKRIGACPVKSVLAPGSQCGYTGFHSPHSDYTVKCSSSCGTPLCML